MLQKIFTSIFFNSAAGQKKVVIVQPISNGRFTIIPQEQQTNREYNL